jgi:hypothetical protein
MEATAKRRTRRRSPYVGSPCRACGHELHRATNKAGREAAKAKIAKLDARGAANLSARNRAFNSFEAHNPGKTLEATGSKTSRVFVSVADRQPTKAAPRTQERNVALGTADRAEAERALRRVQVRALVATAALDYAQKAEATARAHTPETWGRP